MMSNELFDQGWVSATIGDYLYLKNGYAFKSKDYVEASNQSVPIIRISDLNGNIASDDNAAHVLNGIDGFEVHQNDLLIAMSGATTGKVGIYKGKEPAYQNQRVGNIKLHSEEYGNTNYRNYLISALSKQILDIAYGGAQPNISGKAIEAIEIVLPSLAEQKVIVEKLDTLLAQVEETKARLESTLETLNQFRQSVLAAAVSGRLTEDWRDAEVSNHLSFNSLKVLESLKNKLIKDKLVKKDLLFQLGEQQFSVPADWHFVKLKSLATKITDGEHKTPKRETTGRWLLSARNVRDGYISLDDVDYVGEEEYEKLRKRCDPQKGDVLISCSGSVGRISLVDKNDSYVMVRSAALIKTIDGHIHNRYLEYVLRSPMLQKLIGESSKSTAQANLFLGPIKELDIPLPSVAEQQEIVNRIEKLFAGADASEQQVNQALERVDNLTQSILAKAFRGELTEQWRKENPELISGDNSAEALLKKIKAERADSKNKRKKGNRK